MIHSVTAPEALRARTVDAVRAYGTARQLGATLARQKAARHEYARCLAAVRSHFGGPTAEYREFMRDVYAEAGYSADALR